MCGIAGKLSLDGRPVDGALVQRMASLLAHRGPDDEGVRVTGPIGLASRRLSIIDLDTGRQPIGNEDGTVWVVLNGEIYNFVELRAELERRGHRFQSRTDTEVIVHLYEDHGPALLERLRGMFAFALWDASRRRLMLARDRLGEKPLFYAHRPGRALSFASELKSLRVDAELALTLDPAAVDQYLSLLYIPAPATIFTEVRKLPAGHYLLAGEGGIEVREYWDVPLPPAGEGATLDRAALDERLSEAIRLQLRSDVPLGAFLSGGIDSTTIVAGMVEHVGPGIMTCSVGFSEAGFSELPFAERAAACVGSLHASRIAEPPSLARLQHLAWHLDEPFGDSSAVPTWEVSRLAREKVTVALSGDGGDELFGGYRRHVLEGWEHAGRAAGGALARAIGRLARAVPRGVGGRNTLARLAAAPARACAEKFQFGAGAPALKAIYTRELRAALAGADPLAPFVRAYERAAGADPLNRILYVDLKTYLPDDILVKVDRMSMAHGLEVRAPFLDHRLVELVAALPGPTKVRARGAKPLLRAALARRVAREVWDRPKHGFTAPIGSWLRRELREGVEACLFAPDGLGRALFERAALRRLWQAHLGGADHAHEIWMLLMLELWHRARPDGPRAAEAAA